VFEARYSEMSWALGKEEDKERDSQTTNQKYDCFEPKGDYLVKMRGLPFEAGPREVERFFEGLPVMERGILVCKDATGRPSGEAYCEFPTEALVTEAVKRDNTNMGHR